VKGFILSDNEIEARVQKQTKTERIINIFLLFCAVFFSGILIFYYTKPDYEYLNFARLAVYPITGILGMVIGAYLVAVISSKKWKPKNSNLFFLLFIIPCVALFTLLIITLVLTDPFVILNMFLPNPNDYLSALLSISAVMFFYGGLISFVCLYIDEIAEKFKKEKSGNEIEKNVQKQTKTERINKGLYYIVVFLSSFISNLILNIWNLREQQDGKLLFFSD
jgi:Phosphotransferase system, fructose-specific IIC component